MENYTRIAIIEPATLIREGLLSIFKMIKNNIQISSYESINQFLEYKKKASFNLIVISSTTTISDIEKVQNIINIHSETKWIGCLTSNFNRDFLALMDNTIYINDSIEKIQQIINNCSLSYKNSEDKIFKNKLSKREIDVLKLLVKGNANREIAYKLNISIHTVISHRKNITKKLGVKSTAAMAIYAVAYNIIDINDSLKSMK